METIQTLLTHLTMALEFRYRLLATEQRAMGLAEAVEQIQDGVIVVDASGRPQIVNARAECILRQGDGLSVVAGRLRTSTPALTRQLHRSISTFSTATARQKKQLCLPRRVPRLPLLLSIMPVWRLARSEPGMRGPRVIIFVREPDVPVVIDKAALADVFRLTPRERDVVALLAAGLSIENIARRLELTVGTVRWNLKGVFDKTGAHSEVALVSLMRGFGSNDE
jgi:DNA-binding CsgD family transcriptional regulator